MSGNGIFEWPDGRRYEGDYLDDKKHGNGSFRWSDGRIYSGTWLNGRQHGEGVYINPQGQKRKGFWNCGKREKWLEKNEYDTNQDQYEGPTD